jgi:hypothetical protein
MTFGHNPTHPQAKKARAASIKDDLPYWQQIQVNLIFTALGTTPIATKQAIIRALQFAYRKGYTKGYGDGTNIVQQETLPS